MMFNHSLRALGVIFVSVLLSCTLLNAGHQKGHRHTGYMLTHSEFENLSTYKQKEYIGVLLHFFKAQEKSQNFSEVEKQAYFKQLLNQLFLSAAYAHGGAHEEEPKQRKVKREVTETRQSVVPEEPDTSLPGVLCNPQKQKCCIHSGNLIPQSGDRCLGGKYIGCETDGTAGFKCNILMFGKNSESNEFCVPKGEPHNYTDQCHALADKAESHAAQKAFVKDNEEAWNNLKIAMDRYCESPQQHNIPNCESLKKRTTELTGTAFETKGVVDASATVLTNEEPVKILKEILGVAELKTTSDLKPALDKYLEEFRQKKANGTLAAEDDEKLDKLHDALHEVAGHGDPVVGPLIKETSALQSAAESAADKKSAAPAPVLVPSSKGPKEGDKQTITNHHGKPMVQTFTGGEWLPPDGHH